MKRAKEVNIIKTRISLDVEFQELKTPCKDKRENLVRLPLTGAVCETVKIADLRDGHARLDSLIKTRTRRAWKGFWLVCFLFLFLHFQELFLLEFKIISCWVDLPKG